MIRFKKKFIFLKVNEVWFGYAFKFTDCIGLTANMHVKNKKEKIYGVKQISYTVENGLEEDAGVIFSKFSKTVQVEIKQAEKKAVQCFFHDDVNRFTEFYNQFASSRKIDLISVRRLDEMKAFLRLSYAVSDGKVLAAHSYLVDEEAGIARLMHAASQRLNEGADKQLIGRANKLLHYRDMLHFKTAGIKIYDFGGYANDTTDKGLQGINNFKMSFGGQKVVCNNYSSYAYSIIKKAAAILGLLGKP
jgi:hypothetical protein